jgi:hypothetical protein
MCSFMAAWNEKGDDVKVTNLKKETGREGS